MAIFGGKMEAAGDLRLGLNLAGLKPAGIEIFGQNGKWLEIPIIL